MFAIFALLHLIFVHGPDGQEIEVNIEEISSIREVSKSNDEHFAKNTNCVLVMTNGKFISTAETCKQVIEKIAEVNK